MYHRQGENSVPSAPRGTASIMSVGISRALGSGLVLLHSAPGGVRLPAMSQLQVKARAAWPQLSGSVALSAIKRITPPLLPPSNYCTSPPRFGEMPSQTPGRPRPTPWLSPRAQPILTHGMAGYRGRSAGHDDFGRTFQLQLGRARAPGEAK